MKHYNIGKKQEINPFEGIRVITLADYSLGRERLRSFLDSKSEAVEARKVNDVWVIAYNIDYLDFTTLVDWFSPDRGKFQFKGHWIHFRLEADTMACW